MSPHEAALRGVPVVTVVSPSHPAVARSRQPGWSRLAFSLTLATTLASSGCTDTYCQTGPKYGTQCYAVQGNGDGAGQPPTERSGGSGSVYALSSGRGPGGQKP